MFRNLANATVVIGEILGPHELHDKAFVGELKAGRLVAVRKDAIPRALSGDRLDDPGLRAIPIWSGEKPPHRGG